MKHVINEGGGHVWPFLDVMIPKRLLKILLNPKNIFFWPFHRRLVFISTLSIILKFAVQWKIGLNSEAKVPLEFVFSWVWWRELGERGGHERKWQFETRVSPQTVVCCINNIGEQHLPENNHSVFPHELPQINYVIICIFTLVAFVWLSANCSLQHQQHFVEQHLGENNHSQSHPPWRRSFLWLSQFPEEKHFGKILFFKHPL